MKLKRMLGILLALVMMLSVFPIGNVAFAEDGQGFDVTGSKTADPTELTSAQRETTVTLQLPSAEYKNEVYILFTADTSSSVSNNSVDFGKMADKMFSDILKMNPNLDIHVGVLKFTGKISDGIEIVSGGEHKGFVQYSDEIADIVDLAIDAPSTKDWDRSRDPSRAEYGKWPEYEREQSIPGNGSNLQGALDISDEWLDALVENGVDPNKIYLVVLTDGKSYIWNNEDNEPTSYYTQYYKHYAIQQPKSKDNEGKPFLGQATGSYDMEAYPLAPKDGEEYRELFLYGYAQKNGPTPEEKGNIELYESLYNLPADNPYFDEINIVNGDYDEPCLYVETGTAALGGTVKVIASNNGSTLYGYNPNSKSASKLGSSYLNYYQFTPSEEYADFNYFSCNPYEVVKDSDGNPALDENGKVAFDGDSVNEDYYMLHPNSLQKSLYLSGHLWTKLSEKYHCGAVLYQGWGKDGGLGPAYSFTNWMIENSLYAASIEEVDQVTKMFSDISNDMLYMVSEGVVTDKIADDFTLKNDDNKDGFRMTYNGEALSVTFEDGQWYFGEAVDGVYPYSVAYDKKTKTITWTINVPVENSKPITLDYDLVIREDAESDFYETNKSAVLNYTSTDGTKDGTFTFEVPEVSYIKLIDIPVQKVWENGDNWDGVAPESITVNLMEGEEPVQSIDISSEAQWTGVFEQVPDSRIVDGEIQSITYSVEEEDVEKYEAQIAKVTDDVKDGFVITNTHIPETIDITVEKAWDDGDGEYADRPESVKVQLYADKKAVGDPVELSEEGKWTYTWEKQFKYAAGKEIVYTVEEVETPDEYEAKVTGDAKDGFVITNKADAPIEYTITYVLNGGEFDGKPDDILEVYPADTEISIHEKPTREGYEFLYWEGSSYQPGDKYTVTEDHTFTAQWKKVDPDVPDTGDNEPVFYWYAILGVSLLGLFSVIVFDKKRKAAR